MPDREKHSSKSKAASDKEKLAAAEARAEKAERELAELKASLETKDKQRRTEAGKLHKDLKGTKLVASAQFNQDCSVQ